MFQYTMSDFIIALGWRLVFCVKQLFSDVLQQVMEAEFEEKLGYEKSERVSIGDETSCRKITETDTKKIVKTQLGEVDVKVPHDRNGEYEPQIIGKYSRNTDSMEEKILALYAFRMSQRDISEQYNYHRKSYLNSFPYLSNLCNNFIILL